MSGTYPILPGIKRSILRRTVFSTTVQRSVSLKEQRIAWANLPIYEFELSYDLLRQGTLRGHVYSELSTLLNFFETQLGRYDTFNFTDDYDPSNVVVRQCRFDADQLDPQRLEQGGIHWELKKVKLVTVK